MVFVAATAWAAESTIVRAAIAPGAYASLKNGVTLFLEVRPPAVGAEAFLKEYLSESADWRQYTGLRAVPVEFGLLNAPTQRRVLLAVFAGDAIDDAGWLHIVQSPGGESLETIQALCQWLTGAPDGYRRLALPPIEELTAGYCIRIPRELLLAHLQEPTPERVVHVKAEPPVPPTPPPPAPPVEAPAPEPAEPHALPLEAPAPAETPVPADLSVVIEAEESVQADPTTALDCEGAEATSEDVNGDDLFDWTQYAEDLEYGQDSEGPYAIYRLKEGEAMYTSVIVRYTDLETHEVISKACERVQARSGITDPHDLKVGTVIKVPLDMLAPQYMPEGTPEREHYEDVLRVAADLHETHVKSRDLQGVVVILDAGHGGRDYGAAVPELGLYEDELNYDIMCRAKRILEQQTLAKVYVTSRDNSQGYEPTTATRFDHDTDEFLLTDPPYANTDAKVSANLRWYLANSYFRRERAAGVDDRKIVFSSFHCDKLYNGRMRGAMIYIPGARLRNAEEGRSGGEYTRCAEVREAQYVHTTSSDHRRDEALSRNFAVVLLDQLGKHQIRRHKDSDPIRAQIRQDGGVEYVPAVLRGAAVPTKVLIEAANLSNSTDCSRLADPEWRQMFAEAYVAALKAFFNGS
jgi:N-acetylmuramoyl-L-alanine amidase